MNKCMKLTSPEGGATACLIAMTITTRQHHAHIAYSLNHGIENIEPSEMIMGEVQGRSFTCN